MTNQPDTMNRWAAVDPAHIASTCSQRHIQSVLEDAQQTIAELTDALTAILYQVCQGSVLERDACIAQARAARAKATGERLMSNQSDKEQSQDIEALDDVAKARLAAAAPKLLAALRTARTVLVVALKADWDGVTDKEIAQHSTIRTIDEAIADAIGITS